MKKTLILSALALAISSSLVAGTLATYTKTTTPIEATVTAKQFYINHSNIANPTIKLAPGEKSSWKFTINNSENGIVTETDMDLKLDLKLFGEKQLKGLTVELYDADAKKVVATQPVENNEAKVFIKRAFNANEAKSKNFELRVVCDQSTQIQNGAETDIVVSITGEQSPVKYVYTRDKNVNPVKTTATHNTAVYVEEDTITLLGNEYYGDAIFTKTEGNKYSLTSSTLKPQYLGKTFTKTDNVNNYEFMLQGMLPKEAVIEVSATRTVK